MDEDREIEDMDLANDKTWGRIKVSYAFLAGVLISVCANLLVSCLTEGIKALGEKLVLVFPISFWGSLLCLSSAGLYYIGDVVLETLYEAPQKFLRLFRMFMLVFMCTGIFFMLIGLILP